MSKTDVRITDPYTIERVQAVQQKRGDKRLAQTARNLILERITTLDEREAKSNSISEDVRQAGQNAASTAA